MKIENLNILANIVETLTLAIREIGTDGNIHQKLHGETLDKKSISAMLTKAIANKIEAKRHAK